jgi:hypothetical protein
MLGETAATGVMLACTGGSFTGSEGAPPLTAPAKINGVMVATPNARVRDT